MNTPAYHPKSVLKAKIEDLESFNMELLKAMRYTEAWMDGMMLGNYPAIWTERVSVVKTAIKRAEDKE